MRPTLLPTDLPRAPDFGAVPACGPDDHAPPARPGLDVSTLGIVEWFRPGDEARVDWALARLAAEVELLPNLLSTPPSLSLTGASNGPPRDPKALADFVDHNIDRHGDHFGWLELWNEPNNLLDWNWRADTHWHHLSAMIGAAAHWARQRGKRVVLGGCCPTDLAFLDLMGQRGILGVVDAVSLHGFPGTWEADGVDWPGWHDLLAGTRETTAAWNPALQHWITEAGYATWRHDQAAQIQRLGEAAQAGAERLYWYALQDLDPAQPVQQGHQFDPRHYHFGLYNHHGRPKLAARWLEQAATRERAPGLPALLGRAGPGAIAAPGVLRGRRPALITGGAGFIGANLALALAADGEDVLVLDNLSRPGVEANLELLCQQYPARVSVTLTDLRDTAGLEAAVAASSSVFHLAAQTAVTTSLVNPAEDFAVNLAATIGVLEAVRKRPDGPVPVVYASTNKVYGDLRDVPLALDDDGRWMPVDPVLASHGIDEGRPLDFHTAYGCSKGRRTNICWSMPAASACPLPCCA